MSLLSCGSTDFSQLESQEKKPPILVLIGGYNSCKIPFNTPLNIGLYEASASLRAELSEREGFLTIIGCFLPSTSTMQYLFSSDIEHIHKVAVDDFIAAIQQTITKISAYDLYVIGHSYGGWVAVRAAAKFPATVRISEFSTLDSVSPLKCPPKKIAASYASRHPNPDCTTSPQDQAGENILTRQRVTFWQHFYQYTSPYLHAAPISEASENLFFDYPDNPGAFAAHANMDIDPRVWNSINQRILRSEGQ